MPRTVLIPLSEYNDLQPLPPPFKKIKIEVKIEEPAIYPPPTIQFRAVPSKWYELPYKHKPRVIGPTEFKHYLYNIHEDYRPEFRAHYAKREIVDMDYNVIALKTYILTKVLTTRPYTPRQPEYITPEEYQAAFTVLPAETAEATVFELETADF